MDKWNGPKEWAEATFLFKFFGINFMMEWAKATFLFNSIQFSPWNGLKLRSYSNF